MLPRCRLASRPNKFFAIFSCHTRCSNNVQPLLVSEYQSLVTIKIVIVRYDLNRIDRPPVIAPLFFGIIAYFSGYYVSITPRVIIILNYSSSNDLGIFIPLIFLHFLRDFMNPPPFCPRLSENHRPSLIPTTKGPSQCNFTRLFN